MREEKNVLNSDVEIPEVVLKKTDDALAQIRESTKPVRKAKKESPGWLPLCTGGSHCMCSTGWSGWDYRYSSSCSPFMESGHAGQYTGNGRTAERPGRAGNGDRRSRFIEHGSDF